MQNGEDRVKCLGFFFEKIDSSRKIVLTSSSTVKLRWQRRTLVVNTAREEGTPKLTISSFHLTKIDSNGVLYRI